VRFWLFVEATTFLCHKFSLLIVRPGEIAEYGYGGGFRARGWNNPAGDELPPKHFSLLGLE
jgi:hypothetical protein